MTRTKNVALATAVAGLFALGAGHALADEHQAGGEKVKCEGANSCKGQSACGTATNSCSGQNSCKGKGFAMMTKAECEAAKAKLKEK